MLGSGFLLTRHPQAAGGSGFVEANGMSQAWPVYSEQEVEQQQQSQQLTRTPLSMKVNAKAFVPTFAPKLPADWSVSAAHAEARGIRKI